MSILKTTDLTRCFGDLVAVDQISLDVAAGEMFGLLGPNGAGKSTLVKMLTTLLPPTSGSATVAGFDLTRQAAEVRQVIGYVPQLLSADGALTGYENLLVFARLYDIPGAERESRIHEALSFMGLSEAGDRLVRTYSGGMIRRLEIAESVLHRPPLLFLDEPTVGLDPLARDAVWSHITALRDTYGATVVLTTHYMEEADELCDRVAIMHRGQVAVIDSPARLKASLGRAGATMDDVFVHYAEDSLESGGDFLEASRARQIARRVG